MKNQTITSPFGHIEVILKDYQRTIKWLRINKTVKHYKKFNNILTIKKLNQINSFSHGICYYTSAYFNRYIDIQYVHKYGEADLIYKELTQVSTILDILKTVLLENYNEYVLKTTGVFIDPSSFKASFPLTINQINGNNYWFPRGNLSLRIWLLKLTLDKYKNIKPQPNQIIPTQNDSTV